MLCHWAELSCIEESLTYLEWIFSQVFWSLLKILNFSLNQKFLFGTKQFLTKTKKSVLFRNRFWIPIFKVSSEPRNKTVVSLFFGCSKSWRRFVRPNFVRRSTFLSFIDVNVVVVVVVVVSLSRASRRCQQNWKKSREWWSQIHFKSVGCHAASHDDDDVDGVNDFF